MQIAAAAAVVLEGVSIRHGNTPSNGGGIYSSGDLTLTNSWVTTNDAATSGGGILSLGTLTLDDSIVHDNAAASALFTGGGGGVMNFGVLNLTRSHRLG